MRKKVIIMSILMLIFSMPFVVYSDEEGKFSVYVDTEGITNSICNNQLANGLKVYTVKNVISKDSGYSYTKGKLTARTNNSLSSFNKITLKDVKEDLNFCSYTQLVKAELNFEEHTEQNAVFFAYALNPITASKGDFINMEASDIEDPRLEFALKKLFDKSGLSTYSVLPSDIEKYNATNFALKAFMFSFYGELSSDYSKVYNGVDMSYFYMQKAYDWIKDLYDNYEEPQGYDKNATINLKDNYKKYYDQIENKVENIDNTIPDECKKVVSDENTDETYENLCIVQGIPEGADDLFKAAVEALAIYDNYYSKNKVEKAPSPGYHPDDSVVELTYYYMREDGTVVTLPKYKNDTRSEEEIIKEIFKENSKFNQGIMVGSYVSRIIFKVDFNDITMGANSAQYYFQLLDPKYSMKPKNYNITKSYFSESLDNAKKMKKQDDKNFDFNGSPVNIKEIFKDDAKNGYLSGKFYVTIDLELSDTGINTLKQSSLSVDDKGKDALVKDDFELTIGFNDPNQLLSGRLLERKSEFGDGGDSNTGISGSGSGYNKSTEIETSNIFYVYSTSGWYGTARASAYANLFYFCKPSSTFVSNCKDTSSTSSKGELKYSDIGEDLSIKSDNKYNIKKCVINKEGMDSEGNSFKLDLSGKISGYNPSDPNSFYDVYCKEEVKFDSIGLFNDGNVVINGSVANGRYINLKASINDQVDCYLRKIDYHSALEDSTGNGKSLIETLQDAYKKYEYYYGLKNPDSNVIKNIKYPASTWTYNNRASINKKSELLTSCSGVECELGEPKKYNTNNKPTDKDCDLIDAVKADGKILYYTCINYACEEKINQSHEEGNLAINNQTPTYKITIYKYDNPKEVLTTVGGLKSTTGSCEKKNTNGRWSCSLSKPSTCEREDYLESLKKDDKIQGELEKATKELENAFNAIKNKLKEYNDVIPNLDGAIDFNFKPYLDYKYTYEEGQKDITGKMTPEVANGYKTFRSEACSKSSSANYECDANSSINVKNLKKASLNDNNYYENAVMNNGNRIYGCYKNGNKYECGNLDYSKYGNDTWYRVVKAKYYHKTVTYKNNYEAKKEYYTDYYGTIKKFDNKNYNELKYTQIPGLPIGMNLQNGKLYNYTITLNDIGIYFDQQGNPVGRLFNSKSGVFKKSENNSKNTISNEYLCTYKVKSKDNCKECPIICTQNCDINYCKNGCKITSVGPKQNYNIRVVSTSKLFPNKRDIGYNWNTLNFKTSLMAFKAYKTIEEVEKSTSTLMLDNGTTPEYSLHVTMTPDLTKAIREYNKDNKFDNDSLDCYDYENQYENVMCYSTFIDKMKEKFPNNIEISGNRPEKKDRKTYKPKTDINSTTENYWTLMIDTKLDTKINIDAGPSWK